MAQEYYSFMMNRFFETLFIQLMASVRFVLILKQGPTNQLFWGVNIHTSQKHQEPPPNQDKPQTRYIEFLNKESWLTLRGF